MLSIALVATTCFSGLFAQNSIEDIPVLDAAEIAKVVGHFTISDAALTGDGAAMVEESIATSKFFVLGEYHYSTEISKLTESLVPVMVRSGYKAATFEVGPHSAKKLKELSEEPKSTEARLKEFNGNHYNSSFEIPAIPFFSSVHDAAFLEAFAEAEMEIWGIDQEFFTSVLFLGEDITESKSDDENYEAIQAAWITARETIKAEFENSKGDPACLDSIKAHPDFQQFQQMFDADDIYAKDVLQRLFESWDIYVNYRRSHEDRVNYLRNNFLENYQAFEQNHEEARYFIKIGSLHAAKTKYSLGSYDIGALTQELAELEQVKSTNAVVIRGTYDDEDYGERLPDLRGFHHEDQWTVINLEALRDGLTSGKFQIITHPDYQKLNGLIMGYDLLFIPPADQKPDDNM